MTSKNDNSLAVLYLLSSPALSRYVVNDCCSRDLFLAVKYAWAKVQLWILYTGSTMSHLVIWGNIRIYKTHTHSRVLWFLSCPWLAPQISLLWCPLGSSLHLLWEGRRGESRGAGRRRRGRKGNSSPLTPASSLVNGSLSFCGNRQCMAPQLCGMFMKYKKWPHFLASGEANATQLTIVNERAACQADQVK